jgi:hypothetical protein
VLYQVDHRHADHPAWPEPCHSTGLASDHGALCRDVR